MLEWYGGGGAFGRTPARQTLRGAADRSQCSYGQSHLQRALEYARPNLEGRSHATRYHYVAERFFGRSSNRNGKIREPNFSSCPWGVEKRIALISLNPGGSTVSPDRLCRWLLLSPDRLPSNQLVMTQELIANMLGVRREGVTEAAGKLEKLGVIRYARGRITVLDRPKLEQLCCECYAVVKKESDRLLPRAAPQ